MDNSTPLQFIASDLEYFFTQSPHLLAILGDDGYFKRINPALENLLGFSQVQLLSQPFLEFVRFEDRAVARAQIDRLSDRDRSVRFGCQIRAGDGHPKCLEWNISLFREAVDGSALFYCTARDITERQRVGQALHDSEHRLRAIFHQTFELIWLLTPDGILLEANKTALTFGGLSAEQVQGQPFWETPWWQTSPEISQQLQEAISWVSPGTFIRYEVDILGANHTATTLDFSLKPVSDEAGEVTLLIAEGRDIVQRQTTDTILRQLAVDIKAWEGLQTTEIQRYAEAVKNMQDGFYLWQLEDPDDISSFRLLLANPAAEKFIAVPNRNVLGRTLQTGFPQMFETELPKLYRQVAISGQKRKLDIDYTIASGETRTFSVKLFALEGRCLGMLFNDITEQRRSQRKMSEQRKQLKILFDKAGVGIGRLDIDGRWIQANDKLCAILGYSCQELLQTSFQAITHPDDAAVDRQCCDALVSGELETSSIEKRYLRKDGEPVWCSVTVSLIRDDTARTSYFIAFIDNINDRKTTELALQQQTNELAQTNLVLARTMAQLEKRNQELDRFAYVASHDLKAPLRAIGNLATWIDEDIGNDLPDENRQQLDLLQGRVHRMEKLIDGLLAYSRAGQSSMTFEEVDLKTLLEEEIDLLAPMAALTIEIAPDLPKFYTDRVPLARVFANLISNAIKHHHRSNGRIEISWTPGCNGFYEFSVGDDGPGIDEAYHAKIFEIFQVLEARDKVESTGIGLAIVKKTVEAEGGEIFVESEVGKGTTFRFTWPMHPERPRRI
ncbi:PAS domain S-box protein [Oscillatoriales cyanobacterium LEGE 11467]|uniref:histidine kinase n=1 Tax=Zarconia navalis LEGE 11467 TaxID=1828826 RepID=A0A928VXK0_9CYAN|nr:PAS domain S-box protein [Zarconia navalis]MBE9040111.1 PAS domain S-box protein [Zarconia navalis LEGE 11467]